MDEGTRRETNAVGGANALTAVMDWMDWISLCANVSCDEVVSCFLRPFFGIPDTIPSSLAFGVRPLGVGRNRDIFSNVVPRQDLALCRPKSLFSV
jgi:hypothetical protein